MNNEETSATPTEASSAPAILTSDSTATQLPPQAPVQSPVDDASSPWVAKEQYDARVAEVETQRAGMMRKSLSIRSFYTLLAIGGLTLFVMYIGMLIWPFHYISKGNCTGSFLNIAFWLNPIGYLVLLIAGIVGATIKHHAARPLGIIFIVVSPIAWLITGVGILGSLFCGV